MIEKQARKVKFMMAVFRTFLGTLRNIRILVIILVTLYQNTIDSKKVIDLF